jgi:hypothetical protein
MSPYSEMNPKARRFAKALIRCDRRFAKHMQVLPRGHFEAHIRAPRASHAGALVCFSARRGAIWLRFAPPRAFYKIDTERELFEVVRGLLTSKVLFVLLSKKRRWSGTTLVNRGTRPTLAPGESARVLSWSGRFDTRVRASAPRKGR